MNAPSLSLQEAEPAYRAQQLVVRTTDNAVQSLDPSQFRAIEAVPQFAARWAQDAAKLYGNDRVLTATVNASGACPIGKKALCGQYCFAHRSWSGSTSPRPHTPLLYLQDARRLEELGVDVGIFLSYDTEPFPGGVISDISAKLLRVMTEAPPRSLLVHSHAAHVGDPEIVSLMRDVSQATELIVGIGFETDAEDTGSLHPHFHSVADRFRAIERLADAGVKTQASTTPLLGFRDFPGFVRSFYNAGVHRLMTGELRKEFLGGGTKKANGLHIQGLQAPTEQEALDIARQHPFPGGVEVRETFYVTMT